MMQTDDPLRTLHARDDLVIDGVNLAACALSAVKALERIATALEAQIADQHDQAAFSRLLLKGISPEQANGVEFEDYRETPAGWEVLITGQGWRTATLAEEQEIADMNQKRRRR